MYSKIVNPITGRAVNVNGRIGKKILKQYVNQLGGGKHENQRSDKRQAGDRRGPGWWKMVSQPAKSMTRMLPLSSSSDPYMSDDRYGSVESRRV